MPRRCASTSASFDRRSSWPLQPTDAPSLTFGPPCPHVPRLMAGTVTLVRPKRTVRMSGRMLQRPAEAGRYTLGMSCVFCDDVRKAGEVLAEDDWLWIVLHDDWAVRGHTMVVWKR